MKTILHLFLVGVMLATAAVAHAGDTAEPTASAEPSQTVTTNTSRARDSATMNTGSQTGSNMVLGTQTGWIGIRVAPVSEAMGKQLALPGDTGLTVVNLIEDGPADSGGIKRYDVISAVNGKPTPRRPEAFVQQVISQEPGRQLRFELIRSGKRIKKTVTVARPRTLNEVHYKYDADGRPVRDVNAVQAKVFRKVNNNWVVESDPNRLKQVLGRRNEVLTQLANADKTPDEPFAEALAWTDVENNRFFVTRNGEELTVVKDPADANAASSGESSVWTNTYESPDEFRQADPNTYRQFSRLARRQRDLTRANRQRMDRWQRAQAEPQPVERITVAQCKGQHEARSTKVLVEKEEHVPPDADEATDIKAEAELALADDRQPPKPLGEGGSETRARSRTRGVRAPRETRAASAEPSRGRQAPAAPRTRRGPGDSVGVGGKAPGKGKLSEADRTELMARISKLLREMEELKKLVRARPQPAEQYIVERDGSVTVIRRLDGAEVRWEFVNLKDFAEEAPKLHKRYRVLQKASQAD